MATLLEGQALIARWIWLRRSALCSALILAVLSARGADIKTAMFNQSVSTTEWNLGDLNPALPQDWTGYDFLVLEFRASSSERFELGLRTAEGFISKRIHPLPGVWVRASIPLRFYRQGLGDAGDLAATVNQPRNSYWINIESGGFGPTDAVQSLRVVMRYPVGTPTLEIRSVTLAKTDPGDAVLDGGNPVVDEFGQYAHVDWPGKAHSESELKKNWAAEADALAKSGSLPDRDKYGGFASTTAKATGFFRVEQINNIWWFVDPDGHYFYSTGINGISSQPGTRVAGREAMFPPLPPGAVPATASPTAPVSFYAANLIRRYGQNWMPAWAALTAHRLQAWGINTASGSAVNDAQDNKVPYVLTLRDWQVGNSIMGMPDVYSDGFVQHVEASATAQLASRKDDPWLLGYFIGNEPPWPNREGQLADLILAGPPSEIQNRLKTALVQGDTPQVRKQFVLDAFAHYLAVINAAVKKADPNHLNLGIRFGGTPPDDVISLGTGFDVFSVNKYSFEPPPAYLEKVHALTGLPILIGEFHAGVPDRGMAPGLVQVLNQEERGVAYQYYVEHAAAHPYVIGTHWFQWMDEPSTGRADGENYNIGWIDVTDQPYTELVEAAKLTHARLLDVHSGKIAPVTRRALTSGTGTPVDSQRLGLPGIQ